MFPLPGGDCPEEAGALAGALEEGLRRLCRPGGPAPRVEAEGGGGRLSSLAVRLDGVDFDPPAPPRPGADRRPGPRVERFSLAGKGIRFRGSPLDARVDAAGVAFAVAGSGGETVLVPESAREGRADLHLPRTSLEAALGEGIRAAAAGQKVKVEDVRLELEPEGDAVRVRVLLTVKMLFAAKVRVAARLEPTPAPGLRIADVSCRGDGMSGAAVAKLARKSVEGLEGRELGLEGIVPPGLRPREVTLAVEDGLRVRAVLGEG